MLNSRPELAPPPLPTLRLGRYIAGFAVSVALACAPLLGKLGIPGFDALLTLVPNGVHETLLPLSAIVMGIIAVVVQWYGYDRWALEFLKSMLRRTLVLGILGLIAVTLVQIFCVVKVPILDGKDSVSVLVGFHRPPNPRCPTQMSDLECLRRITLDPAEISSVWGDGQIQVSTVAFVLSYLMFASACAMLVGTLFLRDSYEGAIREHGAAPHQRQFGRGRRAHLIDTEIVLGQEFLKGAKQSTALLIANASKAAAQAADESDPERLAALFQKWQFADTCAEAAKLILLRAYSQLKVFTSDRESVLSQPLSARVWRIERDQSLLFARLGKIVPTVLETARHDLLVGYLQSFDIEQSAIDELIERMEYPQRVFEEARKKWRIDKSVVARVSPNPDAPIHISDTPMPASDFPPDPTATSVSVARMSLPVERDAVRLFYSYSHRDGSFREQLLTHLSALRRTGIISEWHDRMIPAGEEWNTEIDKYLELAQVIVLLISADFLASDYCYGVEMERAIQKHKAGEARVVPIIVRPVDYEGMPFAGLQALPTGAKPVTEWLNIDEAWTDVAKGLRQVCKQMCSRMHDPRS